MILSSPFFAKLLTRMRPGKDHTDGLLREAIKYFLDDQVHCAKPSVHYLRWLMNLLPVTDHGFLKLGGLGKAGRFGRLNLFLIKFQFLTWSGQQALVMFKTRADPNLLEVWSHRVENLVQADWMLAHTLNFHVRSARYQGDHGSSSWLLTMVSRISHMHKFLETSSP